MLGLFLCAALTLAASLSFLSRYWWMLEIPAHFRPQIAAVCGACVLLAALLRERSSAAVALVLLFANVLPLTPYLGPKSAAAADAGPQLKVMTFNLHGDSTDPERLRKYIDDLNPDIVLLTEMPRTAKLRAQMLEPWQQRYPYRIDGGLGGWANDILLLSRWKAENWTIDRGADPTLPVLSARLCSVPGTPCVTLVGLHATRAFKAGADDRAAQLRITARMAAHSEDQTVILMGDLNLTPWAAAFTKLLQDGKVWDTGTIDFLQATWLMRFPLLGLPIDHVLVSRNVVVLDRKVSPFLGSDHRALSAVLAIGH